MRILIATITAGAGHLAAASALQEAWSLLRPDDTLEKVDLLDFTSKLYRKFFAEGYVKLIEAAPEIYGMVFKKTDNHEKASEAAEFRRKFAYRTSKGFVKHIKEFAPDAVLCVHPLPLDVLGHLRATGVTPDPLSVCVVTDFEAHALWIGPSVDLYCVAAPETKASLVARAVRAEDVSVTGIPILSKFSQTPDSAAVRRAMGLRDDLPVVLVLGGGFGMGPVAQILEQLDRMEFLFQTVVVAGRNVELRRELAIQDRRHPTHILGFCGNMHQLMGASDIIVTKPGGLTTSEALAIGRPLVVINPIPGQESANSDFLLEHGAAVKINRLEDLPFRLEQALEPAKLRRMSEAAKALGRPRAAQEICQAVLDRMRKRDDQVESRSLSAKTSF